MRDPCFADCDTWAALVARLRRWNHWHHLVWGPERAS